MTDRMRVMAIGAHPDDCEFRFGGTATLLARRGAAVCLLSVTDGGAGHHAMDRDALVRRRRDEARAAAALIGAESRVLDMPDGALEPTAENRMTLMREIRQFKPDLVLTHRPNDYHPDHRYTSQLVQDTAYLVGVPLLAGDTPALRGNPRFGYFADAFTKPCAFHADVVVNVDTVMDVKCDMIACHASQVFEWLPWVEQCEADMPADDVGRRRWLGARIHRRGAAEADRHRAQLVARYGPRGTEVRCAEALERCEYGAPWDDAFVERMFGGV